MIPRSAFLAKHARQIAVASSASDDQSRPAPEVGPAPPWCPLRTGPVTVEGES